MATVITLPSSGESTTAPVLPVPAPNQGTAPAGAEVQAPPPARSMYDLETHLQALADSVETVEPEQEQQFLADFREALMAAKDKRDRVASFMAYCDAMAEMSAKEIARLQKRKDLFLRTVERLEGYVEKILRELGKDAKGKWQKLDGNTSSFSLRNLPPSTVITDEAKVPTEYKTVTVTLPAPLWEQILDSLPMEVSNQVLDAVKKPNSAISKALVKEAIETKVPGWKDLLKDRPSVFTEDVPGAAIAAGGTKLVRG